MELGILAGDSREFPISSLPPGSSVSGGVDTHLTHSGQAQSLPVLGINSGSLPGQPIPDSTVKTLG